MKVDTTNVGQKNRGLLYKPTFLAVQAIMGVIFSKVLLGCCLFVVCV